MNVVEVKGRKAMRRFVEFQQELYRGVDVYVPPMTTSELDCLDPAQNPAFEFCEAVFYMIEGKGRIAGIINHNSNRITGRAQCRFSYFDFVDDTDVSRALLDAVAAWGRSHGMTELVGPLGLTDLDAEGCLVEGFDQLATSVEIYNYPYYARHYEAYGLKPEAYWHAFHMTMPDGKPDEVLPAKHQRIADIVKQRYGLQVLCIKDAKTIVSRYGKRIFELYNAAYAELYGFSPLSDRQIDYYINLYLPQVRLDLVRLVVDSDDNLIAFGIACPSLSQAQRQAKGRMWPFGWFYLARTMYLTRNSFWGRLLHGGTDTCDLLLIAIRPDMQGKGVNALLFADLMPQFARNGYRYVESNNELETNCKVSNMWHDFIHVENKRRCTFIGKL